MFCWFVCSRVCGNSHGLIRKYALNCCRQCFRSNAKEIGFIKVIYIYMLTISLTVCPWDWLTTPIWCFVSISLQYRWRSMSFKQEHWVFLRFQNVYALISVMDLSALNYFNKDFLAVEFFNCLGCSTLKSLFCHCLSYIFLLNWSDSFTIELLSKNIKILPEALANNCFLVRIFYCACLKIKHVYF